VTLLQGKGIEILAQRNFCEKEILFQADLEKLIGKLPFEKGKLLTQAFTNKKAICS